MKTSPHQRGSGWVNIPIVWSIWECTACELFQLVDWNVVLQKSLQDLGERRSCFFQALCVFCIPSWEPRNPFSKNIWRWCSLSKSGMISEGKPVFCVVFVGDKRCCTSPNQKKSCEDMWWSWKGTTTNPKNGVQKCGEWWITIPKNKMTMENHQFLIGATSSNGLSIMSVSPFWNLHWNHQFFHCHVSFPGCEFSKILVASICCQQGYLQNSSAKQDSSGRTSGQQTSGWFLNKKKPQPS